MSIPWQAGTVIPQGPTDILDYSMDFALWLMGNSVIQQATVQNIGCSCDAPRIVGTEVIFRVSNVLTHNAYVNLTVISSDGQREVVVFRFKSRKD